LIGRYQHIPQVRCDRGRALSVMMESEIDCQRGCSELAELPGGDQPVVPVSGKPRREPGPCHDQNRCDRSTDEPEPGVSLAHVVHQSSRHHVPLVEAGRYDREGSLVSVTLVHFGLSQEDLSKSRREPSFDLASLAPGQRPGGGYVEEPSDQVGRAARQLLARQVSLVLAVDTQNRHGSELETVGSDVVAAVVADAVCAGFDVG